MSQTAVVADGVRTAMFFALGLLPVVLNELAMRQERPPTDLAEPNLLFLLAGVPFVLTMVWSPGAHPMRRLFVTLLWLTALLYAILVFVLTVL